jgi:ribonucleotide monophosphatase NagD (HAD superfamily)
MAVAAGFVKQLTPNKYPVSLLTNLGQASNEEVAKYDQEQLSWLNAA